MSLAKFDENGDLIVNKDRWQAVVGESAPWRGRYERIVAHILPNQTVVEFGCGAELIRDLLPPGCVYQPVDLLMRSPETIVINLLQEKPSSIGNTYDVAVFAGVLEYVPDPIEIVYDTLKICPKVIFTYATTDQHPDRTRRTAHHGWFSHMSDAEIVEQLGRRCKVAGVGRWGKQHLYVSKRAP